jgi:hypothetical protein
MMKAAWLITKLLTGAGLSMAGMVVVVNVFINSTGNTVDTKITSSSENRSSSNQGESDFGTIEAVNYSKKN